MTTTPSVIFEILRSFVVLSRRLNVSHTATELQQTRQTIKRHIAQLEEIRGKQLFEINNRQYFLTKDGEEELAWAEALLDRLDFWLDSRYQTATSLANVVRDTKTNYFFAQRHQATDIWRMAPPLIQKGMEMWGQSHAQLESPKLKKIRNYMVVYRRIDKDWTLVEVGKHSSYATWLGEAWAKSAIGLKFTQDPTKSEIDAFLMDGYDTVGKTGSVWYDHISTEMTRWEGKAPVPVNYQRLIFGLLFPDGQQAIGVLVARTNKIQIDNMPAKSFLKMNEDDAMDFKV